MKTSILTSIFALFVAITGFSQDYDSDLQALLPRIGQAKSAADYSLLASQLGSLAQSEPNRWEASFWSAHCMVLQAFAETDSDKVDPILDAAEPVVEKLIKQQPTEAEFYVLKAMLNQARIGVNPMLRGMKYSGRANDNLDLALQFDAANPRAWHLKGSNTYFTPAMFGGGKKRAMPMLQKADSLFKTYKPHSPYHPNWGADRNAEMLQSCETD
ncbi:MAG: hypothetical protein PHQ65_17770 [Bacteroidales bacterium]|nr:hypothetical protein [Bacteroidales bacterium]MDD3667112.1 hypothetical protein [Bacteroidales bacterium]